MTMFSFLQRARTSVKNTKQNLHNISSQDMKTELIHQSGILNKHGGLARMNYQKNKSSENKNVFVLRKYFSIYSELGF